ncbi:hypothetical protein HIM_09669 [Hirsutella minnesotensis 3608]|uniref:Uncharacterized protein n=1 Tax=Hirsutella minnesotensis 3608 TaxID=1043627 RepID=A0A0F7ZL68_9HYPO|nr:hypothetical protein HIM_09669 [Hirsutella minnesotensis 3608]
MPTVEEIEKMLALGLYYNEPEPAILCIRCGFALKTDTDEFLAISVRSMASQGRPGGDSTASCFLCNSLNRLSWQEGQMGQLSIPISLYRRELPASTAAFGQPAWCSFYNTSSSHIGM